MKALRKARPWPSVLVASGVVAAVVLAAYGLGVFERLELMTMDVRGELRKYKTENSRVAVIGTTSRCMEVLGRVPWPRSRYARMIDILKAGGARVIAFDIFFPGESELQEDKALGESIRKAGNVILPVFTGARPKAYEGGAFVVHAVQTSLPLLARSAHAQGHINVLTDRDEVVRRIPAALEYGEQRYFQIGVEASAAYLGVPRRNLRCANGVLEIGTLSIPLEPPGDLRVNYFVLEDLVRYSLDPGRRDRPELLVEKVNRRASPVVEFYPFHTVLAGKAPPDAFRGKVVLIGQTVHGLQNTDRFSTPFGTMFGTLIQATLADNILSGNLRTRVRSSTAVLSTVLFSLLMGVAFRAVGVKGAVGLFCGSLAGVVGAAVWMDAYRGIIMDVMPLAATGFLHLGWATSSNLLAARKEVGRKSGELDDLRRGEDVAASDVLARVRTCLGTPSLLQGRG